MTNMQKEKFIKNQKVLQEIDKFPQEVKFINRKKKFLIKNQFLKLLSPLWTKRELTARDKPLNRQIFTKRYVIQTIPKNSEKSQVVGKG